VDPLGSFRSDSVIRSERMSEPVCDRLDEVRRERELRGSLEIVNKRDGDVPSKGGFIITKADYYINLVLAGVDISVRVTL